MGLAAILPAFADRYRHSVLSDMGGAWAVALVALAGITIKWVTFHSDVYPYSISQPSSYQHVVITDTSKRKIDYFFPSLGSFVTNVNIYSDGSDQDEAGFLRSIGGKHVHRSAWLTIMGKRWPLIFADFSGISGKWTEEQVTLPEQGRVWHLTASYSHRNKGQLAIMLKMLRSFRSNSTTRSH